MMRLKGVVCPNLSALPTWKVTPVSCSVDLLHYEIILGGIKNVVQGLGLSLGVSAWAG